MSFRPQTSTSGMTVTPELSRPDGGSANGVSLRTIAKRNASSSPSTNTGHRDAEVGEHHRADVDGRVAPVGGDEPERHADGDREEHREERQLDGRRQALDEQLRDGLASA